MAVNGDRHADRRDHEHQSESHPSVDAAEQLGSRLRRDHAVDREPPDGEEKGQRRAEVRPAKAEDPPREDDLRKARTRTGVAEEAEDHGRRNRAGGRRCETVPDAEPVVSGEQARREKARVVDERAAPQKRELTRLAVALVRRDRFDPVRFNLAESVGLGLSSGNVAHRSPSAGITQFRFMRSAHRRPLSPLVGASSR